MEDTYTHYILLSQKVAQKIEKGLTARPFQRQIQEDTQVLTGSLWRIPFDEIESHRKTFTLYSVELDDVVLQNFPVSSPEICKLSKEHFNLLYAVPTCGDRFKVFEDKKWLAEAVHLTVGSVVYLVNMPGFVEPKIPGRVRYKGPLPNEKGSWFGIELSAEFRGKGTCDGNFRRKRFFTSHMASAVFKPLNRIAFCNNPDEFREGEEYDVPPLNVPPASLPPPPPLNIGDHVIWISDVQPEKAVVKWIGVLPDARDPIEWMVGVEFEHPVGTGTGKYKDKQLFKAIQGHASLIPVLGLMKEADFREVYGLSVSGIPPSSIPASVALPPDVRHGRIPDEHMIAPEPQSIAREESSHPDKYEPMDGGLTSPVTPKIPYTEFTAKPEHVVPMRDADQYNLNKPLQNTTALVTNRTESTLSVETASTDTNATQIGNHYDRFNDVCDHARFNTVHHSQPSQLASKQQLDKRMVSTTERPVHQKFQSDRYQRATGPGVFASLPPERPEKQILDREGMGIYDTHPYENMERGKADRQSNEDIYEPTAFDGRHTHTLNEWKHVPRKGELNGHQKYSSSVDIRPSEPSRMGHSRFGVGSVDGLDTRNYGSKVPGTHGLVSTAENLRIADATSPEDDLHTAMVDRAAERRANYQHSNTDPQKFSHSDDFGLHGNHDTRAGHHTAPGGTPEENFGYLIHPANSTVPLPHKYPDEPTLDYKNLGKPKKSPKAKSVEDILKPAQFEPMPQYFGNSVFYQSVARNDENMEESYRQLLNEENSSSSTSQSTDPSATGRSTASNSRSNTVKSSTKNQRSSSADDLDSGLSYHTMSSEHHASTIPSDYKYDHKDGHSYKKEGYTFNTAKPISRITEKKKPIEMTPAMANTDLEIGSTVEVVGNPENFRYGVIRWLGYMGDKNKPLVGLEMEVENSSCTDGTFGDFRLFKCPLRKAFFVFLSKVRKDSRFQESPDFAERRGSEAFGTMECPDITGEVLPPICGGKLPEYLGKDRGIQGHHNSCYMDATLFSMFAFSTVFDDLLKPQPGSNATKDKVQLVLREGIVNPLRENFYVRADKIMKLRVLLDEHSKVQGLTDSEKDPEEFLNSLLQDTLKAPAFFKLSSGLQSYLYQMILERDDQILLPTTQQLLGLSFLQSNLKLAECPKRMVLQMPRCGKKYKMYQRVVPSLTLDITDILDQAPRECTICSNLATFECTDCFKHFGDGSLLDIAFCDDCLNRIHRHTKRSSHQPTPLLLPDNLVDRYTKTNNSIVEIPRVTMELFAIICIETSHYVAVVRAGDEPDSPWLFFDSMADRMGEQHGYNVPEVKLCKELPEWLRDEHRDRIKMRKDDRDLPEHLKRVLCDGYICMYESREHGPLR